MSERCRLRNLESIDGVQQQNRLLHLYLPFLQFFSFFFFIFFSFQHPNTILMMMMTIWWSKATRLLEFSRSCRKSARRRSRGKKRDERTNGRTNKAFLGVGFKGMYSNY